MTPAWQYGAIAFAAAWCTAVSTIAQNPPTIIESEGEALVSVAPDEAGFRFTRRFTGPTMPEAMKQVRAFERAIAQGVTDLELTECRQEPVNISATQRPIALDASVELWIPLTPADSAVIGPDALIDVAERVRKLGVTVSSEVSFAGFAVLDREPVEQEAVERAAEDALYLADVAGALAQRHVVDVERLTIVETAWEGVSAPVNGNIPVPPNVTCRARIRIEYRYESGERR